MSKAINKITRELQELFITQLKVSSTAIEKKLQKTHAPRKLPIHKGEIYYNITCFLLPDETCRKEIEMSRAIYNDNYSLRSHRKHFDSRAIWLLQLCV